MTPGVIHFCCFRGACAYQDKRYHHTMLRRLLPVAALSLVFFAALHHAPSQPSPASSATLQGDAAHPAEAHGWVDTQLYFGLGPYNDRTRGVSEEQWREFLDTEVTPRFPAGLSVVDVYGQWQFKAHDAPDRERSKLLILDYPATAANDASIEAIRIAWKQRTHAQSVLRVTQPADVSF